MSQQLRQLLAKWKATGRVYHVFPHKKAIAFSGYKLMPYWQAEQYLKQFFN